MCKMKIDRETAVKSMLTSLKKGIDKQTILRDFIQNYTNSRKTFYNYFDAANVQYIDFMSVAAPVIRAKEIQALGEIAVSNILSKTEAQYILSQIAKGKVNIKKDAISRNGIEKLSNKPSAAERVNAIDKLAKMNGWNIVEEDHIDEIQEIKVIRIGNGA